MFRKTVAALGAACAIAAAPLASAQVCTKSVLPPTGNTSTFGSAPSNNYRNIRCVYLVRATELAAAGFTNGISPTTLGFEYTVGSGVSNAAPLKIYMENTADTTNLKSTAWATAIGTMTLVHDASTSLPATAGPFDITLTGGSPFTYTGGGIYIGFDWGDFAGWTGPTTGTTIACNVALTNGLLRAQVTTATAPTTLGLSTFRPVTRLNGIPAVNNDIAVNQVRSLGEVPLCSAPGQVITARIVNNGVNAATNLPVTLTVTGANSFTDTQNIASLSSCEGATFVTFAPFVPTVQGANTITVSVPADDNTANNSMGRALNVTVNDYSYKHPGSTASGGVGLTTVGAFVAKFTTTVPETITHAKLEFFAVTATNYRVAIYGDNAGVPSTTPLYVDAANRTVLAAGPVTIPLDAPVAVPAGTFWLGLQQTNTTNGNISFDTESPIRAGTFFFATALPVATWIDEAPNNGFKLNIGYIGSACAPPPTGACCTKSGCTEAITSAACTAIEGTWHEGQTCAAACTPPPACPGNTNGDGNVDVTDLLAVIGAWGPCADPNNCPADVAPAGGDDLVNVTDLLAVIGGWGACP